MNEFDILRTAAEAVLEKETATEGEIALARLVLAYASNHRDVSFKTLSSLRARCNALLECFRSLRTLVARLETERAMGFFGDLLDEPIADAKKSLEKAQKYG
jgi:hypothetical protein